MKRLITFLILIVFTISVSFSQDQSVKDEQNHVSLSIGGVNLFNHDPGLGVHSHYIRKIGKSIFGGGVGIEAVFGDHHHYTGSGILEINPYKGIIVAYALGLSFEENTSNPYLSNHIELAYEFEVDSFTFGPVVELSIETEENHFMLGVACGIAF